MTGKIFKDWIKKEGYTVISFSKKLGCKPCTLYRIFNTNATTASMAELILYKTNGAIDFRKSE